MYYKSVHQILFLMLRRITPKLEIKGNITAEGGVIGGFEIEQGNGVNPYDNTSVSNLVARTTTFNTASIVSDSPYFEFQSCG